MSFDEQSRCSIVIQLQFERRRSDPFATVHRCLALHWHQVLHQLPFAIFELEASAGQMRSRIWN